MCSILTEHIIHFKDSQSLITYRVTIHSLAAGWQGGPARTQRDGHHLSQQQQQAAVPRGCEPGEAHWLHPAPPAPQLTTPPRTAEEGKTEGQARSG